MEGLFFKIVVVAASITSLAFPALAQQVPLEGISFKLGDDVQAVKNGLKTNLDPEPLENFSPSSVVNMNARRTTLFLRTKGIRVNFSKAGVVEMIIFGPPFAGSINGIRLGDTEDKVRDLKGKPIKAPWQFGLAQAFLYALDDTAYIRVDISESEGVQSILILK